MACCVLASLRMKAQNSTLSRWSVSMLWFADCSICSKNSVSTVGFICRECTNGTVGIAVAFVATVLIASLGLAMGSYLVSPEETRAGQGIVDRLTRRIPMQSVKIIIVVWQILTQVGTFNRRRAYICILV